MNTQKRSRSHVRALANRFWLFAAGLATAAPATAQTPMPQMVDQNLVVERVVSQLTMPTSMAFIGMNDFLILEKATGRVRRVVGGTIQSTVLDLAVNSASERGLLGIALHPAFPATPWVYLYWTESKTGADSTALADVNVLANRVDRFVWNGSTLTMDRNLIRLRTLQEDAGQPARGNHNGGVLRFGPDGKLYVFMGDNGRRGQMQNLPDGPGANGVAPALPAPLMGNLPDDQFTSGGPEPDNEHLTGMILRLNDDGTTPTDNPFYSAGTKRGGEAGTNLQKVFAYGVRNGFGMAFDPVSGALWDAQNGDDSFTELNRVTAGSNLGWVQVMGPLSRIAEFKAIETSAQFSGLQQVRWSPTRTADTAQQALARMFMVYDGGDRFGTVLTGGEENPPVTTTARAVAEFKVESNGTMTYRLWAETAIANVTMAHIHLGAYLQNGPIVVNLNPAARSYAAGEVMAQGTITDATVMALPPRFTDDTVKGIAERIRQGRAYVNVHTQANPGGEIRGQLTVLDRDPVSHYNEPEFAWKFEIAPAGLGFINSRELGPQYEHDMVIGAATANLQQGHLFRFQLTGNRQRIGVDDPRLEDRVADNLAKNELTESESLLFGTGFGIGTDIHTGPNGKLYVVSLSHGAVYEISRRQTGQGNN